MKHNLLTAIIPCYNFEKFIKTCIDSVLNQKTDFDFQIFIHDDKSIDTTYDVVRNNYCDHSQIRITRSEKNVGITNNLKFLLDEVTTPYIFIIDGDDFLVDESYFQRAVDFLEENKNFSLYCTGYKHLYNNDTFYPQDDTFFESPIEYIKLEDISNINYISMGRVFRNIKNIVQPWINDTYHEDWLMNVEILKHGMAKSEKKFGAVYRLTNTGRITSLNDRERDEKNKKTENIVKTRLNNKVITILDCFVHNDVVENKLKNIIDWLKNDGHDILLVSNTIVNKEILKNVNFYLYDCRNQLFEEKYESYNLIKLYKTIDDYFIINDIIPETQPHGLSVLVNLFNAVAYAKSLGYTHFQRLEVDGVFGEISRNYIKMIPFLCNDVNKKGMYYRNEYQTVPDVSFHYFYLEINVFLEKFTKISCEQDYVNYLKTHYQDKKFKIVERYLYENLKRIDDDQLLIKDGQEMINDFKDTIWNTVSTPVNFDSKYGKCTTKLYYVNEYNKITSEYYRGNSYIVYTYSYCPEEIVRDIVVEKITGEKYTLTHKTLTTGYWCWNEISGDVKSISVYENERLLYTELASDCISYVDWKR